MEQRSGARWGIRCALFPLDSVNEKSQLPKERLYSDKRKEEHQESWNWWQEGTE
jgi:hypothetical protein